MSTIFRKNFGARYLIFKNHQLIKCRLWNEGLSIRYLVHGKSMVRVFGLKTLKHDKVCFNSTYNLIY